MTPTTIEGKGWEHPVSEEQVRWAFAAEQRGELPAGTALTWARRWYSTVGADDKTRFFGDFASAIEAQEPLREATASIVDLFRNPLLPARPTLELEYDMASPSVSLADWQVVSRGTKKGIAATMPGAKDAQVNEVMLSHVRKYLPAGGTFSQAYPAFYTNELAGYMTSSSVTIDTVAAAAKAWVQNGFAPKPRRAPPSVSRDRPATVPVTTDTPQSPDDELEARFVANNANMQAGFVASPVGPSGTIDAIAVSPQGIQFGTWAPGNELEAILVSPAGIQFGSWAKAFVTA